MANKHSVHQSVIKRDLTRDEIAKELNVHLETVGRYDREGAPHERRGRQNFYNVPEYREWMKANNKTGELGRPGTDSPDLEAAKLAKEREMAENWRLRNEQLRGELVNKSEYRQHWMREVQTIKNKCRGLGAAVAPQCVGMDAGEVQRIIDDRIEQIFRELSE